MPKTTQVIMTHAGLQPFEANATASNATANLGAWLGHWEKAQLIELHDTSLCMPHEMAYARALGLKSDEGKTPWAAYETQTLEQPCAWLHPCHLDVGMTDMVMQPTHQLRLTDSESRELHALIAPYFEQDGITLRYHSATRWLALGAQFENLECASLERVQGRSINAFLPDAGEFPVQLKLARLQAEVQMLLYTHPSTEARQESGQAAVNSFWIDGAGLLDALPSKTSEVILDTRLLAAAHSQAAYTQAWQTLLTEYALQAEQARAAGERFGITFCGEKSAQSFWAAAPRWSRKISSFLGLYHPPDIRSML